MTNQESIDQIHRFLTGHGFPEKIDSAVILGSGLGDFTEALDEPESIPYSEIPGFPETSVQGHSGELFRGKIHDREIIAFSGRFHHYEGHAFSSTVLPVHLAHAFGAEKLIISNAAGAINTRFSVGDLVVLDDIIRLFHSIAASPSEPFRYNLYPIADRGRSLAAEIGLEVQRGTYIYLKGPNYESKAEIRAFRTLGADVVGMSTAPELSEASRLGIRTAAISLVTNMAAGVLPKKLDHSEVKEAAEARKDDFARLVSVLIEKL